MDGTVIAIDLVGCARCRGEGHKALTFSLLTHPVECGDNELTHWATCPENGEPILMGLRAKPEPLDTGPKARDADPETSQAAAEKMVLSGKADSARTKLWLAFLTNGGGLTDYEAACIADLSVRSEYATRCSELRNAGMIAATGEERDGEHAGTPRLVSRITEKGRAQYRAHYVKTCPQCGRDLHGYVGPLCRYCDGTAE